MGDCLRPLPPHHAPCPSVTPTVSTNAESLTSTCSTIAHTVCLAGVWGEASPQVPPEARWTAGRSRGASQPWAEGARGGERGRVGALLGLSYPDISDEVAIAILGELGMTTLSQALEARGEARGEVKGKREALQRILRRRFGALPETVERRIDAATTEQLDDLLDRAAVVEDLTAF